MMMITATLNVVLNSGLGSPIGLIVVCRWRLLFDPTFIRSLNWVPTPAGCKLVWNNLDERGQGGTSFTNRGYSKHFYRVFERIEYITKSK